MTPYCPHCETDLDDATGICPACRWDSLSVLAPDPTPVDARSITERYRGTEYDSARVRQLVQPHEGIGRGRLFVILSLLAMGAVYGTVMVSTGALR